MRRAYWKIFAILLLATLSCEIGERATMEPQEPTPESTVSARSQESLATLPPGQKAPKPVHSGDPTGGELGAEATTSPPPLPTSDPALSEWTVLIYMNADNDLDRSGLRDLNEIEAAGESTRTNVLVQLDRAEGPDAADQAWSGARRYEVRFDEDPEEIVSPVVAELGEVNMGDAETLADFVAWGIDSYPANHYALVIWDHGGGWMGIAYDDSQGDELSMADLNTGLQDALSRAGRSRLDIIGFDACLMGQLEVYQAIQPYADIAVASEELIPGQGWDYRTLLRQLQRDPTMEPAQFAEEMVSTYSAFYESESNAFVTMAAIDLHHIPKVVSTLEDLAGELTAQTELISGAVGDARQGAEAYSLVYPDDADHYATLDLWHFASILSRRSSSRPVSAAAQGVMEAVTSAILAEAHGTAYRHSAGISFYFPRTKDWYQDRYASLSPAWSNFLQGYYRNGQEKVSPPTVHIAHLEGTTANAQMPAYLDFEISGRDIENVYVMGTRQEGEGRVRLVEYDYLIPEPTYLPDGEVLYQWQDGVHEDFFVWNTTAVYLSDGANGGFVVLRPTGYESDLYAVEGQYLAEGGAALDAALVFNAKTRQLESVWSYHGGEKRRAPRELLPRTGDSFQVYDIYVEQDDTLTYEPGVTFVFTDENTLSYDYYPLASGNYQIGFRAETRTGETAEAFSEITVANDGLSPGYQAYLDPYKGFQFLFPLAWHRPRYENGNLYTSDADGETWLTVSLYPGVARGSANDLKMQALQTFGDVDVLYEETATVAGESALLTAYGYNADDASRTGVFMTFISRQLNIGFVVDVDGPAATEANTLEVLSQVVQSWQFRPVGFGLFPGQWGRLELNNLSVAVPLEYEHQELENGWQLFKTGSAFVSLRSDPISGNGRPAIAERWMRVAGAGVEGFEAGQPYRFVLSEKVWSRADFSYEGKGGTVWGFIMSTILNGREVVAWAEAPANVYNDTEQKVFLTLVADALNEIRGESGLLFESTFDGDGTWGIGDMEGANGRVADGVYEFSVDSEQGFFWTTAGQSFNNGVFELEVTQSDGPIDNGFGMLLRVDREREAFYVFEISGDGYVWIGRCEEGCATAQSLVEDGWFLSPAVKQGLEAKNQLRVEANGEQLRFLVNDVEVGSIDGAAQEVGDIGLFVETLGEGGVIVNFDNFHVTAP